MKGTARIRSGGLEGWLARSPSNADLVLLLVCVVWGSTFVVIKVGLTNTLPFNFLATRFAVGFLVFLFLTGHRLGALSGREVLRGVFIGLLLIAGYATQTVGLSLTTASKAGFITGLSVVLVPLFARFLLGHRIGWGVAGGVGLATVGLGLLSLTPDLRPEPGDLWVLACAVAFAGHILAIAELSRGCDALRLALVQTGVVALGGGLLALLFEGGLALPSGPGLFATLYTGILGTGLVLGLQIPAQKYTSPSHAALIFSAEPVFAALFAAALLAERLGPKELAGGGLILAGMLLAELKREPTKPEGRAGNGD
jgi:drug/metabolite transporter (DMT)-like permease